MCLVALALEAHERFPLVLASNRDEFFDRPAAALDWWTPAAGRAPILAGRDLRGGGTWLGLNAQGRLALVTNVRNPADNDAAAPSRGEIVPAWLQAEDGASSVDALCTRLATRGYNGVNLLAAAPGADGGWLWASNRAPAPRRLAAGFHALSNAGLDTPWPKVERLKQSLREALAKEASSGELAADLFAALADRSEAADEQLPRTGVPLDWERWLSPVFIRTPDGRYGTRCSTLVITERLDGGRLLTRVIERSFEPGLEARASERVVELPDWPPSPARAC